MRDVELIACRLRRVEPLCRLTNSALQQLAICCFYEDLEKGVTREWIRNNCGFLSGPTLLIEFWISNSANVADSVSCWRAGKILVCCTGRSTWSSLSCSNRWWWKGKDEICVICYMMNIFFECQVHGNTTRNWIFFFRFFIVSVCFFYSSELEKNSNTQQANEQDT